MFENLSELDNKEEERFLISCSGFFSDNLEHIHNWLGCFYSRQWSSTSRMENYINEKPAWPVWVCVVTVLQKTKNTNVLFRIEHSLKILANILTISLILYVFWFSWALLKKLFLQYGLHGFWMFYEKHTSTTERITHIQVYW